MPSLIRKFLLFAAADGIILQAHGTTDRAIHVAYASQTIRECSQGETVRKKDDVQLESHGIIGLLSIASFAFLVAITRREQVAQIFGRPVYAITDVAFLPLSSQAEATKAIKNAVDSRREVPSLSDSDASDSEEENDRRPQTSGDVSSSSTEEDYPAVDQPSSGTRIAQDVFTRKGTYGLFASQWFTKQGWSATASTPQSEKTRSPPNSTNADPTAEKAAAVASGDAAASSESPSTSAAKSNTPIEEDAASKVSGKENIESMLPKIIRSGRLILSSRSFYFSYDFDLTRRLALLKGIPSSPVKEDMDPLYFWNKRLGVSFLNNGYDDFVTPIMQGFVGQRSFVVKKAVATDPNSASVVPVKHEEDISENTEHAVADAEESSRSFESTTQAYLLTLISRRSTKRSGLRYCRRGIDDEGNCANAVETEQILSSPDWDTSQRLRSFVQIRGSIPLYFSQTPYSFKPLPMLHGSTTVNENALKRHFEHLKARYGGVQTAVLVDKHGGEVTIGEAYERTVDALKDSKRLDNVDFEWFDFHAECRGMKFENVEKLVQKLKNKISSFGATVLLDGKIEASQSGIIRTNCMDCLDRTNVAQSAFGQYMLQHDLEQEGYLIDLVHDEETTWFNTLWADNGDAISREYAGSAALKGDYTRSRKRNYRGALNDFSLTLTRYYNNMVNDYFSQAVIDMLLGNVSWKIWLDFETNMMSADPGISIDKVRDAAIDTCVKLVIQDETEDLIHGWTMLSPAHENTLRTLPFEETVVLLTDASLYCCKFDWTTEKVRSFEKVNLRSISKLRYGVYVTSTFTESQMNEELNVGLVVVYVPDNESIIRTNTRSLQNYVAPATKALDRAVEGGASFFSWLPSRSSSTSRTLALKVIPKSSNAELEKSKQSERPLSLAEQICDEIRRAITGSTNHGEQRGLELVEKGDIISVAEAKKRTGYLEQIGHSIKKLVWT